MKTLIIFASKNGATADLATRIGGHFDAVTCDIKNIKEIQLDDFDRIIIGSPVYIGEINKALKKYISANESALLQKKLGLFLCGLQPKEKDIVFNKNFSPQILNHATVKSFLGGIYDPQKTGAFSRFLLRAVATLSGYTNTMDDALVAQFINELG